MVSRDFSKPGKALSRQLSERAKPQRRERKKRVLLASASSRAQRNDLLPDLVLRKVPIAVLQLPARAIRKVDLAHVAELVTSIAAYGQVRPVVVDCDNNVVDGVIIVEAAKVLEMAEVQCLVVGHLTRPELKALRLVLNRTQENGEWDLKELRAEVLEQIELEIPMELTGFSPQEVDIILHEGDAFDEDANEVPGLSPDAPGVSRVGDLWILGRHRLYCGDATDPRSYEQLIGDASNISVMFTDPPYNIRLDGFAVGAGEVHHREFVTGSGELSDEEFVTFLTNFLKASSHHVKDGSLLYVCMDHRHDEHLKIAARASELTYVNTIVWAKGNAGLGGVYRSAHEFILLFKKGTGPITNNVQLGKHGRDRSNIWSFASANQRGSSAQAQAANHPTPKPVELVAEALLDVTKRGEAVLDPFAGSGTAIVAAQKTNRTAYAMELDPLYVDLIVRRYQSFASSEAMHAETGKTFSQIAEERGAPPSLDSCEGLQEV